MRGKIIEMHHTLKGTLEEATNMPVRCEVTMDGRGYVSDDFVAILSKENGDASIFYNTDALTLGMAIKMISKQFVDSMHTLTEEERQEITEVLGEAYVVDNLEVDPNA